MLILVLKEPKESKLWGKRRSELIRVKSLDLFLCDTRELWGYFFLLLTKFQFSVSSFQYIKKKKQKRKRDRGISWNLKNHWNLAAENTTLGKHKQTTSESIETSYSVYWGRDSMICQIWAYSDIDFLRGYFDIHFCRRNTTLVNPYKNTLESVATLHSVSWGWYRVIY